MSSYKKVAVAGATGNLGPHVVQALVDAGFEVTTLSRTGKADTQFRTGTKGQLPSNVKTVQVDYNSEASVVDALRGQDAFVCNLPNADAQPALIDAAIKAGVKRFIPAEFGSNSIGNEKTAALPCFKSGKVVTQDYLKRVADKISYTVIVNGFFLDWGLGVGALLNLRDGPSRVLDGGDLKHSTTLLSDVGKAVAGVLKHPEETRNRAVYVQSVATSQNELIEIAKKVNPQWKPEIQHTTTEQLLRDSYAGLEKGGEDIGSAMLGFILVSAIGDASYGSLWNDKNDNELLGINGLSREGLEQVVHASRLSDLATTGASHYR